MSIVWVNIQVQCFLDTLIFGIRGYIDSNINMRRENKVLCRGINDKLKKVISSKMMQVYLQRSSSSICFGLSKCFYAGHIHATELKRNTAKVSHRIQHQPIGITKDDDLRESPQGSSPPSLDVSGNHDFSQPVDNKFKRLQKIDLSFTKQTLTTEMELKLIFRKRHNTFSYVKRK